MKFVPKHTTTLPSGNMLLVFADIREDQRPVLWANLRWDDKVLIVGCDALLPPGEYVDSDGTPLINPVWWSGLGGSRKGGSYDSLAEGLTPFPVPDDLVTAATVALADPKAVLNNLVAQPPAQETGPYLHLWMGPSPN